MGENSKIEWTHATFNPWVGCSKISQACKHCYAEAWAKRYGLVQWGDQAERRRTSEASWRQPYKWNREAEQAGVPRRVFCASLADVFEDRPELAQWRSDLFVMIEMTPWLDWLVLTKRPKNVLPQLEAIRTHWMADKLPLFNNVWIGATVENQEMADQRIPELLKIPAAVRFLSCEPLLGPIDLRLAVNSGSEASDLHWVIVGGESGPNSRPMQSEWLDNLLAQCRNAQVPAFVKQLGAAYSDPVNGVAGRSLKVSADAATLISRRLTDPKGGDMGEWPDECRVRQFP